MRLLPAAQDLDLVQGAVGRLEGGRHFRKWGRRADDDASWAGRPKRTGILPRSTEQLLGHLLGELGRLSGCVMSMSMPGVYAVSTPVFAPPHILYIATVGVRLVLPAGYRGTLSNAWDPASSR